MQDDGQKYAEAESHSWNPLENVNYVDVSVPGGAVDMMSTASGYRHEDTAKYISKMFGRIF